MIRLLYAYDMPIIILHNMPMIMPIIIMPIIMPIVMPFLICIICL